MFSIDMAKICLVCNTVDGYPYCLKCGSMNVVSLSGLLQKGFVDNGVGVNSEKSRHFGREKDSYSRNNEQKVFTGDQGCLQPRLHKE